MFIRQGKAIGYLVTAFWLMLPHELMRGLNIGSCHTLFLFIGFLALILSIGFWDLIVSFTSGWLFDFFMFAKASSIKSYKVRSLPFFAILRIFSM